MFVRRMINRTEKKIESCSERAMKSERENELLKV